MQVKKRLKLTSKRAWETFRGSIKLKFKAESSRLISRTLAQQSLGIWKYFVLNYGGAVKKVSISIKILIVIRLSVFWVFKEDCPLLDKDNA